MNLICRNLLSSQNFKFSSIWFILEKSSFYFSKSFYLRNKSSLVRRNLEVNKIKQGWVKFVKLFGTLKEKKIKKERL